MAGIKESDFKAKPKAKTLDLSSTGKSLQASREGRGAGSNGSLAGLFQADTNVKTGTDIQQISLSQLVPYSQPEFGFREQPFKVIENAEMAELSEDIKSNGIHQALIVRPHGDGYMLLAGHRRYRAAQMAGLATVPCVIRDVDDATAAQIVVQTNMLHRQKLLHSEKAFAYKLQLEALKQQGKRTDLTSGQIGQKSEGKTSVQQVANDVGESAKQVQRYVRLTKLCSELRDMVDAETMPMTAGVNLSYLPPPLQKYVFDLLSETEKKMDIELSDKIRNAHPLGEDTIEALIIPPASEKKSKDAKEPKPRMIKIPFSDLEAFFPDTAKDEEIIRGIMESLTAIQRLHLSPEMDNIGRNER
jgi:ParB family chromosome partitioning protein